MLFAYISMNNRAFWTHAVMSMKLASIIKPNGMYFNEII